MMVFGTVRRRKAGFSANMEISYQIYMLALQQLNVTGRNTTLIESCRDGCVVPVLFASPGRNAEESTTEMLLVERGTGKSQR